jgi:glutamate--cysteine ligase
MSAQGSSVTGAWGQQIRCAASRREHAYDQPMNSQMDSPADVARLNALTPDRLAAMRRGIEKESLRCDRQGRLAQTSHPAALGSALTHPGITTDFSESQLELITAPNADAHNCLAELRQTHQFVQRTIGDELMWASSMPCELPPDESIPIGRYGSSNLGRAKSIYRAGLGHRYGRRMQTISGIHYNWSYPGLDNEDYFGLIRNFRRHSFLLLVLFGASPAVGQSFVEGRTHELLPLGAYSLHLPHATSLRMGRLGYQSDAQAALNVSYNCLEGYAASLHGALTTPHPPYEAIGLRSPGGEYNQLATSLLQIENEFYGTIRPKRTIRPGERALHALRERGVEYVEVRCMDLDPFEPLGIAIETTRFLDIFLLHCMTAPSPDDTPQEIAALARNQHRAAAHGREVGLTLERGDSEVRLVDWGLEIVAECGPIATRLDDQLGGHEHAQALRTATQRLRDLSSTPSARVLATISKDFGGSFRDFALAQSEQAQRHLRNLPLDAATTARFQRVAHESVLEQRHREAADTMPFEEWRERYLAPEQLLA